MLTRGHSKKKENGLQRFPLDSSDDKNENNIQQLVSVLK
jgi:hypothetical protein